MTDSTWAKSRSRHLAIIDSVDEEELPAKLHLTANSKTGISIDFSIHTTCRPTAVCMGVGSDSAACYALRGFMSFPNAVKHHARNQRLMEYLETSSTTEVQRVASALWSDLPRGTKWLRWNGAGDLTPGAVRLINAMSTRFSGLVLWIISRKPDMVAKIKDRKNIKLLLSLDKSTPPRIAAELRGVQEMFRVGSARLAYTRVSEEDIPPKDAWVVFNKHSGHKFNDWPHEHVCPASLPDTDHVGACDICQWCFK